ncbi:MAG: deoxyguanosinetriphosphate triphosphohydrolase [Gammaproteobacteria bacterium]|jgi:dGTPase|nr:deoxyguanosinetriphosphate triphosphohydrolase [Gammaproteobacteria bacterium]MDP6617389.1 deoxyguanosinetriphosphate triphosphohydrolase [Gammaproteobacteria bacterium]MDP6694636.1 deoxyguanosinetriphosphate triphosphohydrolase [Gammaproteobacteria bacterium]
MQRLTLDPDSGLASYAAQQCVSRGRVHAEEPHPYRGEYQRDRDRIIHSAAFRRLVYKTQVFVNHEGDLYRTRLTHSLEVAQIARTAARTLGLNEQLTEAICLAHDLGHTPFGHAGQDSLNECMRDYGGFEHNLQSLRVVDELEDRYAGFPGLNLSYETREGVLKHCSRRNARTLGELGKRFLEGGQPGLEAQLANLADAIAYNNHDVDDGLRAGLLSVEELCEVTLFNEQYERVRREHPGIGERAVIHETVRGMINGIVTDLLDNSLLQLETAAPACIDEVRTQTGPLISFSEEFQSLHLELKRFLQTNLYRHKKVMEMTNRANGVVRGLFDVYMADPSIMPGEHASRAAQWQEDTGDAGAARAVADYVAGMTDRYALSAYRRLVDASLKF